MYLVLPMDPAAKPTSNQENLLVKKVAEALSASTWVQPVEHKVNMDDIVDYKDLSDEALVKLFQESLDMVLFERLFDRYRLKIYRKVYLYTKDEMDAEDVTQEIFLKLYRKLPRFQFKSQFRTWLYRLVVNTCLDFIKSQKRRATVSIDDKNGKNSSSFDSEEYRDTREEFQETIEVAPSYEITTILQKMKPTDATILNLRFVDDMKLEQIGVVLEISTNTVKQRLHRARKRFISLYNKHFAE